jgi:iron complex transport system ATP-binding protein
MNETTINTATQPGPPEGGTTNGPAVEARDLHAQYPAPGGAIRALNGVSLRVRRGEIVALIGPNGSGKSTLLRCVAGLFAPQSGWVRLNGELIAEQPPVERARRVALLPQRIDALEGLDALEFALLGRYAHLTGWRNFTAADRAIALDALAQADALAYRDRAMNQMSGGERQRVLLARALAQQAPLILLDEPTSALDLKHQMLLYHLLRRLSRREGKTIIAATHDLNLASQFADRIFLLRAGRIVASGTPAETLQPEILRDVYEVDVAHGQFPETLDGTGRPWVLPWARPQP